MSIELTRNFCIIAHIDHGKTTLSDRLLERTGTIQDRERQDQLLDSMDLERERGITIKAHPVAMRYKAKNGKEYRLNLSTRPGHVDFAYEVSRSLAACEGALLIVDAAQGVEAQTVANVHLAHKQGLTIIPVINKIDLPNADIPAVHQQIEDILQIPAEEAIDCSAKMGIGIDEILEAVVAPHSAAGGTEGQHPPRARLRFRLRHLPRRGRLRARDVGQHGSRPDGADDEQRFAPRDQGSRRLHAEDVSAAEAERRRVGYFIANIKTTAEIKIGDTITDLRNPAKEPLPGFKEIHPMVFSGIYPINTADFEHLKAAIGKLQLNDSAFIYQPESSRRARLRIPLRLPRPAPHGDHPGAAPARVRHGHHRHLSQRRLRNPDHARRNLAGR